MVEREHIDIPIEAARKLLSSATLHRLPSGEWTLVVRLEGILCIDSNRTLPLNREIRIQGKQEGRRPKPEVVHCNGRFAKKGKE